MVETPTQPDAGVTRYRTGMEALMGVPATDGNRLELLRNGDEIFPPMLEAIAAAERSIDLMTFLFEGSIGVEFLDAMAERAAAGVRVRVLLDAVGARRIDREAVVRFRQVGGQAEWFRPVGNPRVWEAFHRGHRKVLVCDGALALTGGVGIADQWRGAARSPREWRDTHVRVRGPAVDGLQAAFVNNWAETGRPLFEDGVESFDPQPAAGDSSVQVVRGGARTGWGHISTLVRTLLGLARERLNITSAYFVPDGATLDLLCATARRGVEVNLLLNGDHADKRLSRLASEAHYSELMEAGVRVWAFRPTMIHVKAITVDGAMASLGSANFNSRSLVLDEEVNLVVFDPQFVEELDAHFEEDVLRADRIDADRWSERGRRQRVIEALPGFLARHL